MSNEPTFSAGDKVAIRSSIGWHGLHISHTTIERVTKTQYVTKTGRRFRRTDLREVGGGSSYRPADKLIAADDPVVAEVARKEARQSLVTAVRNAYDKWVQYRDHKAPVDLIAAAQALVDFDTEGES